MKSNPYQAYQQKSIMTMTQSEMLTALYDGLIKQLHIAKIAQKSNQISEVNQSLQKSQAILIHLKQTLDMKYDISENLVALYDYFLQVIVQANIKKDLSQLDEIVEMISELRDTYTQADRDLRLAK